jgi:hypothetical protein
MLLLWRQIKLTNHRLCNPVGGYLGSRGKVFFFHSNNIPAFNRKREGGRGNAAIAATDIHKRFPASFDS